MLIKALESLKRNPVLIAIYAAYLVTIFLLMFGLYPKSFAAGTDPMAAMAVAGKMMLASLLIGFLGIVFLSGYGKMMADVVSDGETTAAGFIEGLKKFFVRVLLAALLLMAFYIGFSIVLGIIMIPLSIMFAMGNSGNPAATAGIIGIISSLAIMVLMIFILPFVLLWYPAIFIEDTGVMDGLKKGAKAGIKSYWLLVPALLAMYIPTIIYMIFNFSNMAAVSRGKIFTPGYLVMCLVVAVISQVFIPFIFIVYNEKKSLQKI